MATCARAWDPGTSRTAAAKQSRQGSFCVGNFSLGRLAAENIGTVPRILDAQSESFQSLDFLVMPSGRLNGSGL